MFVCKRCSYECNRKDYLISHLNKIKECPINFENIDRVIYIKELQTKIYNDKNYKCEFCEKQFNNTSSKSRHKKTCNKKISETSVQLLKMQQQIDKQQEQIEQLKQKPLNNDKINLDLQYYKNRKNENFYQLLLENYLGGTHKTLSCGITDITTDSCHAEIKEWSSWKEAIGQLTCYNTVDPKEKLDMYMFGKYKQSCKDEAIKVTTSCKINIYEFVDTNEGVSIISLENNEEIYKYKPE